MNRASVKFAGLFALLCVLSLSVAAVGAGLFGGSFGGYVLYWVPRKWFIVALWIVLMALAILVGYATSTYHRRMSTERAVRCTGCGYDLRASKDRCPECGKTIEYQSEKNSEDSP